MIKYYYNKAKNQTLLTFKNVIFIENPEKHLKKTSQSVFFQRIKTTKIIFSYFNYH